MRRKKGQSILEYTLLLGVVIGAVVAVLVGQGGMGQKVKDIYQKTGTAVETTGNKLDKGVFSQ